MLLRTSYSAIQKFTQCPRAWYLGDYRRLGPITEPPTGALKFGGRMHTAIELGTTGVYETPLHAWKALMQKEYEIEESLGGFSMAELEKEAVLGTVMLESLDEWRAVEGDDQEFEVVAVEKQLREELMIHTPAGDEVSVWLYGKLDELLVHRDNGQVWIRDWKTTKDLQETAINGVEASPQPRIYARLLEQELPGTHIAGIRYTFLRKVQRSARAKPPFVFAHDMQLSKYNVGHHMRRVEAITGQMVDTFRALEHEVDHEYAAPFTPGWWCSSCPFKNVCYVMQTVSNEAAEDMLTDFFTEKDPLERYDHEEMEA